MLIGFDAKRAVRNMTGLGNYSRLVISQLAQASPGDTLYLYTPDLRDNPRLENIRQLPNVSFRLPPASGFKGSMWRTFGVTNSLRADGVQLYHGLSNELPLNILSAGIPSVVTLHDVIYRRVPGAYSWADRMLYDYKYGRACRNATRVIAISECTKRDAVHYYGIDPDKVDVIYQGCDPSFKVPHTPEELEGVRTRLGLPDRFVLQVGTIEMRKNLGLTVRALSALPPDVKLVAIGRDRRGYKGECERLAREAGVGDRLIFRSDIAFADLPAVNQLADAIAYPSRYEGFGLPVIEGLESRRPVVAATGSCLEEAGGDAALYVDPDDVRGMAEALNAVLGGSAPVAEMAAKGLRHTARFDTSAMAGNILNTYAKALEQAARS